MSLQTKRIPPGTGSKTSLRDPVVELDLAGKVLSSSDVQEIARALVKSMQYDSETGKVTRLEELCLRRNHLDSTSLPYLAEVISVAADHLRDLDLSDNNIEIVTEQDAQAWEQFLGSLAHCNVLRRIDLSGNPLGPKAFELLTKAYAKQEPVDLGPTESHLRGSTPGINHHQGSGSRRDTQQTADKENDMQHGLLACSSVVQMIDSEY